MLIMPIPILSFKIQDGGKGGQMPLTHTPDVNYLYYISLDVNLSLHYSVVLFTSSWYTVVQYEAKEYKSFRLPMKL